MDVSKQAENSCVLIKQPGVAIMQRRQLFHWCSRILSVLAVAFVGIPGIRFLLDPLWRARKRPRRHRLLKLADLEVDVPRKLVIIDQRTDAWTRYPAGPIGAVWVTRREGEVVEAFSTSCPHLGCPVDFLSGNQEYFCACHGGVFAANGSVTAGPAQRGLDTLDVKIEKVADNDWVSVVFERFELGVAVKTPLG